MIRKFANTALIAAAAAGTIALGAGAASAAPWICTSGKASATQLASPMCTGASGSGEDETVPDRVYAPSRDIYVYDPDGRVNAPHNGDFAVVQVQ